MEHGYPPIDKEYATARSPMKYVCTCGEERSISWKRMDRGETGCKPCSSVRGASKRKYTLEQVRERFLHRHLRLVAEEYKNANTPMPYICLVCGVENEIRLGSLNCGHGCKTCAYRIKAAARRMSIAEAREYFEASGLDLLETDYKNNSTPMSYSCKACGHVGAMALKVIRRGGGCSNCQS